MVNLIFNFSIDKHRVSQTNQGVIIMEQLYTLLLGIVFNPELSN